MDVIWNRIDIQAISDFLHSKVGLSSDFVKSHPWASVGIATGTVLIWNYARTPKNLPPGPCGVPLIGAPSCLSLYLHKRMFDWRKTYGEIISFYSFGKLQIVLNSERTIKEAFVKQADDFSTRPGVESLLEDTTSGEEIFTAPFNETWKKNKKFAITTLKNYGFGTARSESKLHDVLQNLEDFIVNTDGSAVDIFEEIKLASSGAMATIILGSDGSKDDTLAKEILKLLNAWNQAMLDAYMVAYPLIYMSLPMSLVRLLTRSYCNKLRKSSLEFIDFMARTMKENAKGIDSREPQSVSDAYIKERGCSDETVSVIAKTIMIFMPDAVDTAPIMIYWCLLYIVHYPEIQEKIREEVMDVIGTGRLPKLSDRSQMPFTEAVMYETMRLILLLAFSLERILTDDVKFDGYTLPKGAEVRANFYGIHYDPEVFPEPFEFKPSRFITNEGKLNTSLAGKLVGFSIGNRRCPGENYFKVMFFLFFTRLMQKFRISFDPSEPTPSLEKDETFISIKPQSYKVCFKAV